MMLGHYCHLLVLQLPPLFFSPVPLRPFRCRYYLENQLSGPLTRIFEGIIENPASLFSGEHTRTITVSRCSAFVVWRALLLVPLVLVHARC